MANKKIPWKKILQAGAYATDAMSRGSAGGLGAAIVNSKIDLSGKDGGMGNKFKNRKDKFKPDPKTEANEWMPEKETLGNFPNKNSNYNV